MKTIPTVKGCSYTVASDQTCAIKDAASGKLLGTAEDGKPCTFAAQSDKTTISDDSATYTANFNRAARKLRLLAGGLTSDLPAGYLRAAFLESTGTQYIQTDVKNNTSLAVEIDCSILQGNDTFPNLAFLCGCEEIGNVGFQMPIVRQGYEGSGYRARCGYNNEISNKWQAAFVVKNRVKNSLAGYVINGDKIHEWENKAEWETSSYINLFTNTPASMLTARGARWFSVEMATSDEKRSLKPCIDVSGTPCMCDLVSKQSFRNDGAGQFIAGFTTAQARKLGKHLPEGGGTLTISLPTGYEQDAAVAESLETARAKGWTLTIQTYTPEAEAAATTFGMRRVWVRRTHTAQGAYVDADGVRWAVEWCVDMLTPDGSTPDEHGYELYRSTAAAVAYWELTPWVDPEAEQEFLTTDEQ